MERFSTPPTSLWVFGCTYARHTVLRFVSQIAFRVPPLRIQPRDRSGFVAVGIAGSPLRTQATKVRSRRWPDIFRLSIQILARPRALNFEFRKMKRS